MKKFIAFAVLLLLFLFFSGCVDQVKDLSKTKVFKDDADLTGGLAKTKLAGLLAGKLSSKFSGTGTTEKDITPTDLEELDTSLEDLADLASGFEKDLDKLDFQG